MPREIYADRTNFKQLASWSKSLYYVLCCGPYRFMWDPKNYILRLEMR